MDLLSFARGPALKVALAVFCLGVVWRIVAFALLRIRRNLSKPRASVLKSWTGGLIAVGSRSWPHPEFIGRTGAGEALGYSYHIGLFAVVLLFTPHIPVPRQLVRLHVAGAAQQRDHRDFGSHADIVSCGVIPARDEPRDADAIQF